MPPSWKRDQVVTGLLGCVQRSVDIGYGIHNPTSGHPCIRQIGMSHSGPNSQFSQLQPILRLPGNKQPPGIYSQNWRSTPVAPAALTSGISAKRLSLLNARVGRVFEYLPGFLQRRHRLPSTTTNLSAIAHFLTGSAKPINYFFEHST